MYNRNVAYDLSLFDEKSSKKNVVKLNIKKIRKKRVFKAKLALMVSVSVVCTGVALGVAAFISGQAQLAECTERITQLSKEYQENESLYTQLSMKKKTEISKDELPSRLENEFGMVKNGSLEYINVMNCNKAEIKGNGNILVNIKNQMCKFCNKLFDI